MANGGSRPPQALLETEHNSRRQVDRLVALNEDGEASERAESGSMTSSEDFEMDDILSPDGLEDDEETGLTSQARRERTRRKRRNTELDERVYPEPDFKKEEDRLTNRTVWGHVLTNTMFILLWYTFSISISVVRLLVTRSVVTFC
jgi:solute carrier family 35, member C2